ncbi:MAG TPA: PKD domain-containing protein [Chitinophagaceae bacterium]|nr:PKD domain-containing protein [Chitinophagaceae bacterium]
MKKILLIICTLGFTLLSRANHITGGEMFYTFIGMSGSNYQYKVTLRLYRDCYSTGAQLDDYAAIAVFDNSNNKMISENRVSRSRIDVLNLSSPSPCITNPPVVCYQVGTYEFTTVLPPNSAGYTIAYQRCCRIAGINNLSFSNNVGATYTAVIPGTAQLPTAPANNSARFKGTDTVVVCANNTFSYSFAAFDPDNDSLSYAFCDAYSGGTTGDPAPDPPLPPPYQSTPYTFPYNSGSPLGNNVTLNTNTGLIKGIAPPAGIYCVTVCVTEYRNGIAIAVQRKDLQIKVADCSLAAASLLPQYTSCDGFTLTFKNLSNSPLINSYAWDFGVTTQTNDTSNLASPTFTFPDTGTYVLKLVTNRGQLCSDSSTAEVKVYPGFFPGFTSTGICISKPTQFTDTTKATYGVVNAWSWDFGESTVSTDISNIQNPTYTYPTMGTKNVRFIVSSDKGCIDTVYKDITIIDKPPIQLIPTDTLICVPDSVQLQALSTGVYSWSPLTNIINPNTPTPIVHPTTSTWYYVDVDEQGCKNRDSVLVRVVDHVTLKALGDTTICLGDPAQLGVASDGLQYQWTPAQYLNDPALASPVAVPPGTTNFQVTATIGSCSASDNVLIKTVPYPIARAGNDTIICYNTTAQLQGSYVGSSFAWSPAATLKNPQTINPVADPLNSTVYILTVYDTIGCPKPGRDTVIVTVLPKVNAFAGNDTSVVIGQPLQLNATGGVSYLWSPPTGLSASNIPNPVGVYTNNFDSIRYKVLVADQAGCLDSASVLVKIFFVEPQVFVPTAFTPNADGLNDILKPIPVGIKQIDYFRIYNRWGQLVFSTNSYVQGWDGTIGGKPQGTNTFVWIVHAIDYTGKPFFRKGTVTLIR